MTIQWGDTGKIVTGTLKTFNITLNPNESLISATQNLGTAAPTGGAAGDVSYTIKASDLPTISPTPISCQYTAHLIVTGQNNSGASGSVNYNLLKNSTAIVSNQSQASIASANYWTQTHYRTTVVVGDVLEIQLWGSATGFTLLYAALILYPRMPQLSNVYILKDVNFTLTAPTLTATGQTPAVAITQGWNVYPTNLTNTAISSASSFTMPSANFSDSSRFYFGRAFYDGVSSAGTYTQTHATNHPYYGRCDYPSQITYREILR